MLFRSPPQAHLSRPFGPAFLVLLPAHKYYQLLSDERGKRFAARPATIKTTAAALDPFLDRRPTHSSQHWRQWWQRDEVRDAGRAALGLCLWRRLGSDTMRYVCFVLFMFVLFPVLAPTTS